MGSMCVFCPYLRLLAPKDEVWQLERDTAALAAEPQPKSPTGEEGPLKVAKNTNATYEHFVPMTAMTFHDSMTAATQVLDV